MLAMDEGDTGHPVFKAASGGLTLSTTQQLVSTSRGALHFVLMSAPSASGTLLRFYGGGTIQYSLLWTAGSGLSLDPIGIYLMPTQYPVLVQLPRSASSAPSIRLGYADGTTVSTALTIGCPRRTDALTINPTLSGGCQATIGHVFITDDPASADLSALASRILGGRIPTIESAVTMLQGFAHGPTISGTTLGETSLPVLEGRDAADAVGAMAIGMGARVMDNFDGTLEWIAFPPSGSVVALPSGEIDPSVTWETSDIGWASDATVTWPDGTSYTATRPDGRRQSVAFEGVHATRSKDRSYADWLVWNTASTGSPRLQQAPYDLGTMADADAVTICSVNVGSRVSLTGLPSQMPTSLLLIVEGIEETITDAQWLVTFKTSPDVYSRLFILDDPVQGVLDAGYLLAP